jgi:hypothetical protein
LKTVESGPSTTPSEVGARVTAEVEAKAEVETEVAADQTTSGNHHVSSWEEDHVEESFPDLKVAVF